MRAARRAERPSHAPAHADAPRRARRRVPADVRARARRRAARRGRRDEPAGDRRRAARAAAAPARTTRARGLTIPRIALRHRLQHDVHGLDRSRHRMLGEDGKLVVELDVHGAPDAAGPRRGARRGRRCTPSGRGVALDAIRKVVDGRWRGLAPDVERALRRRRRVGTACGRRSRRPSDVDAGRPARRSCCGAASVPTSAGRWRCSGCAPGWTSSATT